MMIVDVSWILYVPDESSQSDPGIHGKNQSGSLNAKMKYTNPARGIPDFCKQKLLVPHLEPGTHLEHYNPLAITRFITCDEDEEPIQNIKGPPPGGA